MIDDALYQKLKACGYNELVGLPVDLTEEMTIIQLTSEWLMIKVTMDSPLELRQLVFSQSKFFQVEMMHTQPGEYKPSTFDEDKKTPYEAWLFCKQTNSNSASVIGAMELSTFCKFKRWTILWLWLHHTCRGTDALTAIWNELENHYPEFLSMPPFSNAMVKAASQRGIALREYCEPDTILPPKEVVLKNRKTCVIREATVGDLDDLIAADLIDEESRAHVEALLIERNRKKSMRSIIAICDDRLVGRAWIDLENSYSSSGSTGVIDDLEVNFDMRGQGIGSQMLSYAEELISVAEISKSEIGIGMDNAAMTWLVNRGYLVKDYLHKYVPEFRVGGHEFRWPRYDKVLIFVRDANENSNKLDSAAAAEMASNIRDEYKQMCNRYKDGDTSPATDFLLH